MENWKKIEAQKSPGTLRFEELQEKDRAYTITDEEAVELAELKRRGQLTSARKRSRRKANEEAAVHADIREASDTVFAEIREEQKRKERSSLVRKAWLEGPPRDVVNENGDVIVNPDYPSKKIELP